jgi:hypothetical protein
MRNAFDIDSSSFVPHGGAFRASIQIWQGPRMSAALDQTNVFRSSLFYGRQSRWVRLLDLDLS